MIIAVVSSLSLSAGNSYSSKSGGSASTTSGYLPSATTGSGFESSATTTSSGKSSYDTATVSAGSSSGLGLSSVSSSSKMSVNSSSGNKLVPGMPPGVANVLPAQYMTPAGQSSSLCLTLTNYLLFRFPRLLGSRTGPASGCNVRLLRSPAGGPGGPAEEHPGGQLAPAGE